MTDTTTLEQLLTLERLEENLYRGESVDIGSRQVFGGQVLGQALAAAYETVAADRMSHSLHAYFLRPGDFNAPIVYEVDRQRDGGSFSNRRVVAIQHGRPIFNLAASFQLDQPGIEHSDSMPEVPDPESLTDLASLPEAELAKLPARTRRYLTQVRPLDFRSIGPPQYIDSTPRPAHKQVWFRASEKINGSVRLHESVLAYASDYGLMTTAMLPHGLSMMDPNVQLASLDHAMWFHRPFRADDWLLYDCHSSSASGSRGMTHGRIFARDGTLVASTAQEGLIRMRKS